MHVLINLENQYCAKCEKSAMLFIFCSNSTANEKNSSFWFVYIFVCLSEARNIPLSILFNPKIWLVYYSYRNLSNHTNCSDTVTVTANLYQSNYFDFVAAEILMFHKHNSLITHMQFLFVSQRIKLMSFSC